MAELRADLWQHAIETSEKKFNIDIVKKYGAQQSTPSKNKGQKKLTDTCSVFGYSKQAYYKQLHQNTSAIVKEEAIFFPAA